MASYNDLIMQINQLTVSSGYICDPFGVWLKDFSFFKRQREKYVLLRILSRDGKPLGGN